MCLHSKTDNNKKMKLKFLNNNYSYEITKKNLISEFKYYFYLIQAINLMT